MAAGFTWNMMYREFVAICQKQRVGTVIPSQFAILWNQAQEEEVANMLKVMEVNKDIYDSLMPLKRIASNQVFTVTTNTFGLRVATFTPANPVRRILKLSVRLNGSGYPVKCVLIKSNESTDILNGVFSRPSQHQCYYSKDNNANDTVTVYVPTATTTVNGYLEYYVEPPLVATATVTSTTLESVFNKEVCSKIIQIAARMYIERVQDARYPTYNNEIKQS